MKRRTIKQVAYAAISISALLLQVAFAQEDLYLSKLSNNIALIEGAGTNVLVHSSNEGLSLIDSGSASMVDSLISLLNDEYSNQPVNKLFNTHWHVDQTGGNDALANTGAEIIAHEYTRLWMGTDIISRWENNKVYLPRSIQALPVSTFYYGSQKLELSNSVVEYGHLPQAHTDGDIYIYFPEENVMAAGGVVSGGSYPIFDYSSGGWIGGMVDGLRVLLEKTNEETIFVPASGQLRTRADIEAQIEMCMVAIQALSENFYSGSTFAELVASKPMQNYDQRWGDPTLFLQTAYESSWGHVGDLRRYR